ncbi:type II toxin-antitoxin system Phd/YefM family antitoxin [Levilactobacillus zymae]|uniref:type II toxin-antitoxin system Phd/YefM family antitoxin n=1 Tax=Levilactobacillus zymae TaxID=267363 RepID=UPI0028B53537|nr:type II toxin-antitoxin system Phd/YefM family antitoxin [Levilactobacillus zymae]MDT6980684.1 type II toxin-antitoxin system Phd/YefM family antitoxin [Levilactobacillus zymae]
MKILDVPTSNISELKRSPKNVFDQAQATNTGVYVFNRNTPAGVVLSVADYEDLVKENEALQDQLLELKALERKNHAEPTFTDEQVRGKALASSRPKIDPNDGWE